MFRTIYVLRVILICAVMAISAPAARADYAGSQRWFNSMTEEDRGLLQTHLMLLGHYQALADSTFGNFTYQAIRAFQSSVGEMTTGILTPRQKEVLEETASSVFRDLGFDIVEDTRGSMVLLLPQRLLPSISETQRGTAYTSADGFIRLESIRKPFSEESYGSLYRALSSSSAGRNVTYQVLNSDKFVVSGTRQDKAFYILINHTPGESVGFSIEWDRSRNDIGTMVATFMASYSYPLAFDVPEANSAFNQSTPQATPQRPAPTPQSQDLQSSSGTGFFVADKGVLVTNHHVVSGCSVINVVGYGPARIVTSDEDVDLAVLQLRTPKDHPIAEIRQEPAQLGEAVVALGFPLASILNSSLNIGTGVISSETGLLGEDRWFTTNVGIQPGNSGGPILDESGRVLGVAVAKIDDEALLAVMGTTAPNVGFAIKGGVVADYLDIFRLPEPAPVPDKPLTARELADKGRNFTVQVTCDVQ